MTGALLIMVAVTFTAGYLHHRLRHSWIAQHAWRFGTGAALDGRYRTNATWTRWATETLHPHPVVRWHHMPRLYRMGIRLGIPVALWTVSWGLNVHRFATIAILFALTCVFFLVIVWRLLVLLSTWRHHRRYVRPLRRRLTPALQGPPPRLAIERDRSLAKIWLPDEFTGSEREREEITRAVTVTLAIEAPEPEWNLYRGLDGRKPHVIFRQSEPPPGRVLPAAVLAAIDAAAEHEVVMGIGRKAQVTVISVDNDSPHIGISMGSGDGKSVTAKNMLTQHLHHGGLGLVIDLKLISHMWARDLPNVAYAGTPAEIESALVWLAEEVTRRNQVALASADVEGYVAADVGPRIMLIAEELNATQNRLKKWWQRDMGMKGRSPGSEALDEVMFLGRQVRVNVVQIGQRLSVKASGSGDARENMGVLVFKDPSASTWKMLVGDRHVQPPASGHKGRLQVVTAKTVHETQGTFWTGQQARDFAESGIVAIPRGDMPCIGRVVAREPVAAGVGQAVDFYKGPPDLGIDLGPAPDVPPLQPGAVTLREAFEAGLFVSLDAARKAAHRAGLTAVGERGASKLYALEDLATCGRKK